MTDGQKDLVRYRMERALETLQEARLMLESGHLHGAANRIYYACFYATVALLLTRDLSSPKHSGVMALFNKYFIKEDIVPVDMGKFYSRVFDHRLESDYGEIVELDRDDMKADLEKAKEFITRIKSLLGSIGDGSL
jgi:uncharacterized protein (UPF0332 family)